jgi:AraC-like DNA-binding protein
MEYLRDYRLRQARTRLSGSDESIAQIAARCGFEDAAYFSRAFKAQFGSSPVEFRRYLRALSK